MKYSGLLVILLIAGATACAQSTKDTTRIFYDLQVLSADSMEGRLTGTAGSQKAREYIVKRYAETGLIAYFPEYIQTFDVEGTDTIQGKNILGYLEGQTDSAIVISAHYDHLGIKDGKIYHGADDNASGVAAMLAIAQHFSEHPPRHRIIFAAFDSEESGLQGAKAFTGSLVASAEHILLNINLDMVSQNEQNTLYAAGTTHYPFLKPIIEKVAKMSSIRVAYGHDRKGAPGYDWTYSSDHAPFHRKGIPFVYFGVEDHSHYHQPTDRYETVPKDFFAEVVRFLILFSEETDEVLSEK